MSEDVLAIRGFSGVELDERSAGETTWRTARRCDSGQCVEIGILGATVMIRNSTDPDGACLAMSRGEWQGFLARAKAGDSDGL